LKPGVKGASCGQIITKVAIFTVESRNSLTPYSPSKDLPGWSALEKVSSQLVSAQVVLQTGISWIFTLGIQPDMPFYRIRNLALINRVSFAGLLMALPGTFLLLMVGFDHPVSLLVSGVLMLCLILTLNGARKVQWAQAFFAFSPALVILVYTLLELSSGGMADPLAYILARQGVCLTLLLPVMIYGFERSLKWVILDVCMILFLFFDVASVRLGATFVRDTTGMSQGFFSMLSVLQFVGLAACVLYLQGHTLKHEQQVSQSNEKLQSMAIRDGMIGLFNHSFMEQLIGDAINRSKRSNIPLSLLMIDVDFFKKVNDSYGHNAGDEVLKLMAKLLDGSKRSTDYLGRWGGDELILLLTDTNLQGAVSVAEKLRSLVENHNFPYYHRLTISLGASEYRPQEEVSGFIGRADAALYRAKRAGRNRVETQESSNPQLPSAN
jgi:diguanylate cyclase (GGDEF)-like protein